MNRVILFRGKRLADGKWIYGYYFEQDMPDGRKPYIRTTQTDRFGTDFCVDPATVGQYTELKDKNGNKIFEGDIIKFYRKTAYVVFRLGEFYAVDNDNTGYCIVQSACEVVGNVHDSPELVEGGEE